VVACACIVEPEFYNSLDVVNDSKKLSPKKREELFDLLSNSPHVRFGLGEVSAAEIDRINILQATFSAMRRALENLKPPDGAFVLVDGNQEIPGIAFKQQTLIKGDGRSLCIAAASILAKVTRDRQLCALESRYPGYGFANHKGYGTAEHSAALERLGPCPEHRRSFISRWLRVPA
jgi:ribonuclease HII